MAAQLESIVAEQAATIDKLSVEREHYRKLYMDLLERCAMLEKGIVTGKKAERFKGQDAQLTLQMLEMLLAQEDEGAAPEPAENDTEKVQERERKKHTITSMSESVGDLPHLDDHAPEQVGPVGGWHSTLRQDGRPTYYERLYDRTDGDSPSRFRGMNPNLRGPPKS